jgi:hypothetical protein
MPVMAFIGAPIDRADVIIVMSPWRSIESGVPLLCCRAHDLLHGGIEFPVGDNAALLLGTAASSWALTAVRPQQRLQTSKIKGSFR